MNPPYWPDGYIDIAVAAQIEADIGDGYIRQITHPDDPTLRLLNYTPQAQYQQHWTIATRVCRGLILRGRKVVARPFPKFWNWGELDAESQTQRLQTPPRTIADKLDGSLGIIYPHPDGRPAVATRGSFTSEQAQWATEWLRDHIPDGPDFGPVTPLVEIIYPDNRIVVDYGDRAELVYLDAIHNHYGSSERSGDASTVADLWQHYSLPVADTYNLDMRHILEGDGPHPNDGTAEGYVFTWPDGFRTKVKLDEYVRLHRIVTGINARHIWQLLVDAEPGNWNDALQPVVDRVPDEFYEWVMRVADHLIDAHMEIEMQAVLQFRNIVEGIGPDGTRKDFALAAKHADHPQLQFLLYDQKYDQVFDRIWRLVEPPPDPPDFLIDDEGN